MTGRLPAPHVTELQPGLFVPIDPGNAVETTTWWQGLRYEEPTAAVLLGWLAEAERFFDIGANYGWYSYVAVCRASHVDVVAFEPNVELVERMQAVQVAHDLVRFSVEHTALGDANDEMSLHLGADPAYATLGDHPNLPPGEHLVSVATFDAWRERRGIELPPCPSWVAKIDAEGYELKILKGMSGSLRAQAFAGLVVELNDFTLAFCGTSAAEVIAELTSHGYQRLDVAVRSGVENGFFVPVPIGAAG